MPWVQVDERDEEVQSNGRASRDDEICEDVVAELEALTLPVRRQELSDHNVKRRESGVCHDDTVEGHAEEIHPLGTLWSVAHRKNELYADQQDTAVAEYNEDDFANVMSERVDSWIRQRAGDKVECEIEIGL